MNQTTRRRLRLKLRTSLGSGAFASALLVLPSAATAQAPPPATAIAAQATTQGQRIFIAGHSFNVFICAPLEALAKEAGYTGHATYGVQFIGNSTPMQHWNQGTDETNVAKLVLRTGALDVLTLSPNVTMPEEAIDKFADLAQQTNPTIRVLVQQSWPAFDGNVPSFGDGPAAAAAGRGRGTTLPQADAGSTSPPQFPMGCPAPRAAGARGGGRGGTGAAPPAGARSGQPPAGPARASFQNTDRDVQTAADIDQRRKNAEPYMARMRAQLEAINARHGRQMAYVVPAGEAVARLREHVIAGKFPGVTKQSELFVDAMGHADGVVSDLVSYVWFATLYQRNPVGMTALDAAKTPTSKARHQLLQQIAWASVLDEPMSGVRPQ